GGIAHDFNNVLAAMLGYAELASIAADDPNTVRRHINEILRAGSRARDLVRQILTFSRQVEVKRRPVRLPSILEEVITLAKAGMPANITLSCEFDGSNQYVLADPGQIHQIVMNLITNAVHSMKPDGGRLSIRIDDTHVEDDRADDLETVAGCDCVRLTVADTGCGMDALVRERIFEPFFTTKPVGEGTGMGLSTIHGIVTNSGGAIRVESEVGKGTAFKVYFPVTEAPDSAPVEEERLPLGRGEHVMLVDDEEALVRIGVAVLDRLNYTVTATTNSQEALEIFRANPDTFHVVITDQNMPDMTGLALTKKLLSIRPGLPVILATGYSDVASPEHAEANGIKGYLTKPMSTGELARAIRGALDA
ncbi:MAG: response regulator, partial [bacterium]|nr:response regulator [bacterium]